ncbi:hypothetical protein HU200_009600 [Digitaria exilis]|uniref:Uncharacterized protein n=1 Tax=Digitaria exilis TaxID=1010633 RepID=A0A835FJQ4_9POAL|nr:hypothetical protein HU200_009600 [Digitaria exilis]
MSSSSPTPASARSAFACAAGGRLPRCRSAAARCRRDPAPGTWCRG